MDNFFVRLCRQRAAALSLGLMAFLMTACGDPNDTPTTEIRASVTRAAVTSAVADAQFKVTAMQKVSEVRVSRTVFDYTYKISVKNNGTTDAANVEATLTAAPAGTVIVDGAAAVGSIAASATSPPASDVIVLRQDRTIAFDPAKLTWSFVTSAAVTLEPVKPAEVVELSLADIGFTNGAKKVVASGAISNALIKDGTLRFATPGDTGKEQAATLNIDSGGTSIPLSVVIRTLRPTAPAAYIEPSDDGSEPTAPPTLLVTGLGPNNTFTGNAVTFKLAGTPQLDLAEDSVGVVEGANKAKVSLRNYWVFNQADTSFSISGNAMQQLLAAMPSGALSVSLNFVSMDGKFTAVYDMLAIKQGAKLSGKLQTPQGGAVTTIAGKKILLKGFNAQLRAVATIDGSGNFSFDNVIPDTYQLTLDDLENPNVVSASTVIFAGTTQANVTLVYALPSAGTAMAKQAVQSASFVASKVTQNGKAPAARSAAATRNNGPEVKAMASTLAGGTTFSATAALQNQTVTTPISFTVPQGTKNVGVKITVYTAEYPVYTTAQSQFNDTWSYAVTGLPATTLSASGSVNQSHFTQGSTTKTACVDVSAQALNAAFTVGGAVSATNIGDSALATVTTVELNLACAGLKVSSATFSSPNANARPVLEPIITENENNVIVNLSGPYLSVQQSAPDATHTLPLEIKFSPADAKITEVHVSVSAAGATPAFSTTNLLAQTHVASPGKIKFSRLSLPAFPGGMSSGKFAVTVRLKGTVNETATESDPSEGGQVTFDGKSAFTPLYLAGNVAALSTRRYNAPHDVGGDSWATKQTIDWLLARSYRFDDISSMHVAQTALGRSVLNHAGHSDGQQIDMRYADGQGGYTDTLGGIGTGTHIQALINAAAVEVATNAAQKPKLALLQAWIAANRTMLTTEAANARRVYMGDTFIKLALINGRFAESATATIPGVTTWSKPDNVFSVDGHLHHWHASLNAHP